MEKYSRWRDPGTGIQVGPPFLACLAVGRQRLTPCLLARQPFLTPVPPRAEGSVLHSGLTGLRYAVAAVRVRPAPLLRTEAQRDRR